MELPSTSIDSPYSAESMMSNEEPTCKVCFDKSDGAHFGVDSCRACAAFFRRSVVMKKEYICRQGKNNCDINKSVRCMCRKCRLRKCLDAGMTPESVQSKRDPIVPRRNDSEPLSAYVETSCSENELEEYHATYKPLSQIHRMETPAIGEFVTKTFPEFTTLSKDDMELGFRGDVHSLRQAGGISIRRPGRFDAQIGFGQDYTPARYCEVFRYENEALPAIADFVTRTFPEYSQLNQDERWTVYQNFVVMINCLESAYRTASLWKHEDVGTTKVGNGPNFIVTKCFRYHFTETTFLHRDSVEQFFDMKMNHPQDALNMMRAFFSGPRMKLAKQIDEIQLREEEYATLMTLCMWHSSLENSTESIDKIGSHLRKEIYSQLHLFYKWKGVERYADRIGEVLNLVSSVFFCASKYLVNIEIANLVDAFGEDKLLLNILRNQKPAQFLGA